jgi:hypothetical protein
MERTATFGRTALQVYCSPRRHEPMGYWKIAAGFIASSEKRSEQDELQENSRRKQKPLQWSRTFSSKKGHAFLKRGSTAKHPCVCLT